MSILLFKIFRADLFADDLRAYKVLLRQTEPHLLKDKFNLLLLFHRSKCLHLKAIVENLIGQEMKVFG